jgi:hypothetical protein
MNQHGCQHKGNQHLIVTTDFAMAIWLGHGGIVPNGIFCNPL